MSLLTTIDQDIKAAMIAREQEKLLALRSIKAALLLAKTEKGGGYEPDPADEARLLQKLIKQRQESADIYTQQNRNDLAAKEKAEADIIAAYLPQQMDREEVTAQVKAIIADLGAAGLKDMGKVMGTASKTLAGKADNKTVSEIVRQLLS